MKPSNKVGCTVYRNVCAECGLEVPRSKWNMPLRVVENDQAKILWDFKIHTDKLAMANQPDILLVDKQSNKAIVVHVAIPNESKNQEKEIRKA